MVQQFQRMKLLKDIIKLSFNNLCLALHWKRVSLWFCRFCCIVFCLCSSLYEGKLVCVPLIFIFFLFLAIFGNQVQPDFLILSWFLKQNSPPLALNKELWYWGQIFFTPGGFLIENSGQKNCQTSWGGAEPSSVMLEVIAEVVVKVYAWCQHLFRMGGGG